MNQIITRRALIRKAVALGVSLPALNALLAQPSIAAALQAEVAVTAAAETFSPAGFNRPVCPYGATPELASFIDPTVEIEDPRRVELARHIYIGPFARLLANGAPIKLGEETNMQDNVLIQARFVRPATEQAKVTALGLREDGGVEIAERCILAHGATVKGPAKIGVGGGDIAVDPDNDQEVFLSFNCEVDGAILERNTGVSALGRVGPGVRLKSGFIVLPGKNVTTQAEADDPKLGKVRLLVGADVAFNEAVIEVNVAFASEYTRLYDENPVNVYGINYDPGNTTFNHDRSLPILAGVPTQDPCCCNRIIGDVRMADSRARLDQVMGERISLRADEGEPFMVGRIARMQDNVIFHALEEAELIVGNNVSYGNKAIVHGGGRPVVNPGSDPTEPTIIEDDVTLKDMTVVFRSLIGRGSTIGTKSAVVGSVLAPGTTIPDRTIYVNDAVFGTVEW